MKYTLYYIYRYTLFLVHACSVMFCSVHPVACQAPMTMRFSQEEHGVGCHFLLQGSVPILRSNPSFLYCRRILYHWASREAHIYSITIWGLEKEMAAHSSILSWRIPWTEESGRLQNIESQRVRHDWSNWAHMHTHDLYVCIYYIYIISTSPCALYKERNVTVTKDLLISTY